MMFRADSVRMSKGEARATLAGLALLRPSLALPEVVDVFAARVALALPSSERQRALAPFTRERWTLEQARAAGAADGAAGREPPKGQIAWPGNYMEAWREAAI